MGKLIVFEGVDGVGKSTALAGVARVLRGRGCSVHETYEPTRTQLGRLARRAFGPGGRPSTVLEWKRNELLLAADRVEHAIDVLMPALNSHDFVLCDRYVGSGLAYGASTYPGMTSDGDVVPRFANVDEWLADLYDGCPDPSLVLLLDAPLEVIVERVKARHVDDLTAYDVDLPLLRSVRACYHDQEIRGDRYGHRPKRVDATRDADWVRSYCVELGDFLGWGSALR